MIIKWKYFIIAAIFFVIIILASLFILLQAPKYFPIGSIYTINKGVTLNELASDLENKGVIKSPFLFKSFTVLFGESRGILAGDYVLDSRKNVINLAQRMTHGDYHLERVKITIPEGFTLKEISKVVSEKFIKIKQETFIEKSKNLEGYLFPDTYFFDNNADAETVIKAMQINFENKINEINDLILSFNKTKTDIIKMASILEKEARTVETKRIIAGILWKRISLGMPLQVDASFKYINGKGTADLTFADLKIDSPYNSYLYKGLPPTPICNPGLDSIKASITPIKTDYLYFLTDNTGQMHYAKTYQEHLKNKALYLK